MTSMQRQFQNRCLSEKSLDVVHCDGMQIANAIANYSSNPVGSYDTLEKYGNQSEYYNALFYLNKILMNDSNIKKALQMQKAFLWTT